MHGRISYLGTQVTVVHSIVTLEVPTYLENVKIARHIALVFKLVLGVVGRITTFFIQMCDSIAKSLNCRSLKKLIIKLHAYQPRNK